MKKVKKHFLKLLSFTAIGAFMLSCSNDEVETYNQELESFEEFANGDFEEQGSTEDGESTFVPPEGYNPKDQPETLVMETINGKSSYYISTDGTNYTKVSNAKGPSITSDKQWVATIYNGSNLYGSKSISYFLNNSTTNRWANFNFKPNLDNKARSMVFKGNMEVDIHQHPNLKGIGRYYDRRGKSSYRINQLNRNDYSSIAFKPRDNKDVNVVLYEHSSLGGAPRPVWDNTDLGSSWKSLVSSLDMNTYDYTEGVVLARERDVTSDVWRIFFQDIQLVNRDINDVVKRVVLGRKYANRCNPRSTCYRTGSCSGATVRTYWDGSRDRNIHSPRDCETALRQRLIPLNNRSWCTQNGFCINPSTFEGIR